MTKIRVIGNPGKHDVEIMKVQLAEYLVKLGLSPEEIYLIFIADAKQLKKMFQDFTKIGIEDRGEQMLSVILEALSIQFQVTGYIPKKIRKEGVPPIIIIRKDSNIISKLSLLDEIAHMKEDENGWMEIVKKAVGLLSKDYGYGRFLEIQKTPLVLETTTRIEDFFSGEMMCQYGLFSEIVEFKQELLNEWVEDSPPEAKLKHFQKSILKSWKFYRAMSATFSTSLPPAYPQKENGKKLEEMIINYIRQMEMEVEYRKIKSIVSQLKSPPEVNNVYKCGADIIELAQGFLEKEK